MTTMRAVQWSNPQKGLENDLRVTNDAEAPESEGLSPGWTLVKVAYASLNQVDFKVPELPIGGFLPTNIPCMDYSGVAVRPNRSDMKRGQRVFGKTEPPKFGALAEYLVVASEGCVPVPDGLNLQDAATIGVAGLTAYQCIVPKIKSGGKVLINGASGGVGVFAIQIAKLHGLHVTAVCSGANAELCKSLGADEVVDYKSVDLVQHLIRSGHRYDAIVDLIFLDPNLYWQSGHFLKPAAPYITIAGTPSFSFIRTMIAIYLWPGWLGGGQRPFHFVMCKANSKEYAQIAQWMAEGKIKSVIEKTVAMEDVREAFTRLKSHRTTGKLTVRIGGDDVAV